MLTNQKMNTTVACDDSRHNQCEGYCAPLVYSNTRPCVCDCHDTDNPRDFHSAYARATRSYYAPAYDDYRCSSCGNAAFDLDANHRCQWCRPGCPDCGAHPGQSCYADCARFDD